VRGSSASAAADVSPPIYDLYGVVNHSGSLLGGHYTASARCPMMTDDDKNHIGLLIKINYFLLYFIIS